MDVLVGGDDETLYAVECAALALLLSGWALALLLRRVGSSRPGLSIALPIAVALAVRVVVVAVISSVPWLSDLRGPDDAGFLAQATALSGEPSSASSWTAGYVGDFHLTLLAAQIAVLGEPVDFALRTTQVALAVAGICLVATAAHDLSGPGAARIVAWVLAVEPAGVFFSGVLQKESVMLLAEGLVALGAVRMWNRRDLPAGVLLATGCAIAIATRPYAGLFLLGAALLVTFHAAIRRIGARGRRALPLAAGIAALALAGAAFVGAASSRILAALQDSQFRNTSDQASLALEPVDFSTASGVVVNLPRRVRDVVLRPYPWQRENLSQQFGAVGSSVAWLTVAALLAILLARPRAALRLGPPFAYLLVLVTLGYALSAGNSGTGFRYWTHVLALAVGLGAVVVAAPGRRIGDLRGIPSRIVASRDRSSEPVESK